MTLRLITPDDAPSAEPAHEYLPLPHYPWDERPLTVPVDVEEAATALFLAKGSLPNAALLLKTPQTRLSRLIHAHPRLQRIQRELLELLPHRAVDEIVRALDSPDDRRREWATQRILNSRLARDSPLAPAPQSTATQASLSLDGAGKFVFRWRTEADDQSAEALAETPVIEHEPS